MSEYSFRATGATAFWQSVTLDMLEQLNDHDQLSIDRICERWAFVRDPQLLELIKRRGWQPSGDAFPKTRVLFALKQNQHHLLTPIRQGKVYALIEACQDNDSDIAAQARQELHKLPNAVINILVSQWVYQRQDFLLELFRERDYVPTAPRESRALIALKLNKLDLLYNPDRLMIQVIAMATAEKDPEIADRAVEVLRKLEYRRGRQELCRFLLEKELPRAEQVCVEKGYLPRDPNLKALFYFVTEQWDKYEALDFDYSILQAAYRTADHDLIRRLGAKIRKSGRLEFLNIIANHQAQSPYDNLRYQEAQLMLEVVIANQQWPRLWQLVLDLHISKSTEALHQLKKVQWQPDNPVEAALFTALLELIPDPNIMKFTEIQYISQSLAIIAQHLLDNPFPPEKAATLAQNLFQKPIASFNLDALTLIENLLQTPAKLGTDVKTALRYLKLILVHRYCHAVELADPQPEPAEFDIELD